MDMPGRSEPRVLTNVTAEVKSQTNRARSVAAGVVSGAGWGQPVIQTPYSDESAASRRGRKAHASTARQWSRRVGDWGRYPSTTTHESGDGSNPFQ